jgi:hypothetical protein
MSRIERRAHAPLFAQHADFDEQLYLALRHSPWWMISIAVHVLLFVMSSLFQSAEAGAATSAPSLIAVGGGELPAVDDLPQTDEPEVEIPQATEANAKEPVIRDQDIPLADHDTTDNDQPYEEMFGNDGTSDSMLDGPGKNRSIGVGPGAGSAFGHGRGSWHVGRTGPGGHRERSDEALEDALRWLKAHQSPDGGWEAAGFGKWCDGKPASGPGPDGAGRATYDVGVTGLSLLAFLGAGYTQRSDDKAGFGRVVAAGLRYLKNNQDAEGCLGPRSSGHFVYNHAIAALALVEAFGMTGSPVYKIPTQKALDFIAISRNPYFAWRYGVKAGDNDTSVTGWMMMALKSARLVNAAEVKAGRAAPLVIDEDAFEGIKGWIEKMTDTDFGRVGYQARGSGPARTNDQLDRFPAEKSESMTAVGVLARIFLGENPKTSEPIQKGADLCAKLVPTWNPNDGSIDMYYWYYATLALFQVGGEPWVKWRKAMDTAIVGTQRRDGDFCLYKGSWDPLDPWGPDGGRVYSTACLALCLEVYFRYPKVFGTIGEGG